MSRRTRLTAVKFQHGAPLPRQLRQLAMHVDAPGLTVRELLAMLGEPGVAVLILIFSIPFALPVTIPGLSVPGGILLLLLGIGLAAGRAPWLPERVLARKLEGRRWATILLQAANMTARLERRDGVPPVRPRRSLITGFAVGVAGLTLAAGTPLPFSNFLPGLACLLFAMGVLRVSLPLLALGHASLTLAISYPVLALVLGKAGAQALWHRYFGG